MGIFGFYLDPLYVVIFFLTLIISLAAQLFISTQYKKWSKVPNGAHLTGREVGYAIVNRTSLGGGHEVSGGSSREQDRLGDLLRRGIITEEEYRAKSRTLSFESAADTRTNTSNIGFERVGGNLTDHYDPRSHTVRMSEGTADVQSVAAMAIVAHELGHAQQHENGSFLITMRNVLLPAVRISPRIAYVLIFLGLIFNLTGAFWLGIIFYAIMVLFAILMIFTPIQLRTFRAESW